MNFEDFASPPNTIQNQALANENATVEATENEINFTAEDTSKAVNIADIDTLNNLLGIGKPSETRQMQFGEARISLSTVDGKYDVQHSEFGALTEFGLDTYEEAVAIAKPFAEEAEVQTSEVANKLKIISERRAIATKSDLQNSQLIKDIRVDKTQPKELKPNAADNKLAAIMLYGKTYDTLIEEGLP